MPIPPAELHGHQLPTCELKLVTVQLVTLLTLGVENVPHNKRSNSDLR